MKTRLSDRKYKTKYVVNIRKARLSDGKYKNEQNVNIRKAWLSDGTSEQNSLRSFCNLSSLGDGLLSQDGPG